MSIEPPANPALELLQFLLAPAVIAEAEDALRGVHRLTVETGHPETDDDVDRITALTEAAWAGCAGARTLTVGGGGDYTTIRVAGVAAAGFIDYLTALAARLNPGWWHIRTTSR